ncbi:P-loop ATPase, Sll1717 family [Pseudoxanthomonas beigongshangi]
MTIDLTDDRIFGNDAGDDEDERVLERYFFERPEFLRFYDRANTLRIVKARKGTGKSALLRRTESVAKREHPSDVFVVCKGPEIFPDFSQQRNIENPVLAWQQSICARINRALGASIKVAMTDDQMSLVEAAEIDSFRGRNIVSALSDRLLKKLPVPGSGALERHRIPIGDEYQLLQRYASDESSSVWFLVDDVDATFRNTTTNKANLSAFFSACRDLAQKVRGLTLRIAVRTDVWTLLRGADEALDKCDQYVFNLRWSNEQVAYILVSKVDAYFQIYRPEIAVPGAGEAARKAHSYRMIFQQKYPWGRDKQIDSQTYIALYSQGRPRWSSNLCRAAAVKADSRGHIKIDEPDIKSVLPEYSAQRRLDLTGEHSQEYDHIGSLMQVFSGWRRSFTTQELLGRIHAEHIRKSKEQGSSDAVQLAHLLFRGGVISAVKEDGGKRAKRLEFEENPTLLTSRISLDEGYGWEIPMFLRPALKLGY